MTMHLPDWPWIATWGATMTAALFTPSPAQRIARATAVRFWRGVLAMPNPAALPADVTALGLRVAGIVALPATPDQKKASAVAALTEGLPPILKDAGSDPALVAAASNPAAVALAYDVAGFLGGFLFGEGQNLVAYLRGAKPAA